MNARGWLTTVVFLAGCAKGRPATPELSTLHMVDLVEWADAARLSVVAGHPAVARRHLGRLGEHGFDVAQVGRGLRPYAETLAAEARAGRDAGDLDALGAAVAKVGEACGACHVAAGLVPRFAEAPVAAGSDVGAHMARHQWGVDSLWEGLVTPRDDIWTEGALSFFEVPVDHTRDPAIPEAFAGLAERVHQLGTEAHVVREPEGRAEVYGKLIAACGECHQALGGPVGPPMRE